MVAEHPGQPHNHECAEATGGLCVCSCRGALHGIAHHRQASGAQRRIAGVAVTATHHTGDEHPTTAAGRRAHPVTVTYTGRGGGAMTVTAHSSPLPADLGGLSDDHLMSHLALAAEHGRQGDAERLTREMDRRDGIHRAEVAARRRVPPLHAMSDEQLAQAAHDAGGDEQTLSAVYAEMDRRDQAAVRAAHRAEHEAALKAPISQWAPADTPEDRRVDELLARGWSYLDAYAEVHNLDPAKLARDQAAGTVERRAGERTDRAVRRQYDTQVHLAYVSAEGATRGHLLSPAGKAAGVDPISLFSGPTTRARAYASEDLLRWWADNGRQTFTQFRAAVLGRSRDRAAAKVTAGVARGKDFG